MQQKLKLHTHPLCLSQPGTRGALASSWRRRVCSPAASACATVRPHGCTSPTVTPGASLGPAGAAGPAARDAALPLCRPVPVYVAAAASRCVTPAPRGLAPLWAGVGSALGVTTAEAASGCADCLRPSAGGPVAYRLPPLASAMRAAACSSQPPSSAESRFAGSPAPGADHACVGGEGRCSVAALPL